MAGHPNIVCFVSHNGGLSSQEAAYHGVPVLGVPFFFDHVGYAEKFERLGVGRRLRYSDITESTFHDALVSIIHDPRYRERMQRLRQLMCDQKEPPLERALWWVEHVARTAGAPHLRSPALRLHWYELWMLDLLAGAAIALLAVLVAICALWRLCARPVSGPGTAAGLKVKVG